MKVEGDLQVRGWAVLRGAVEADLLAEVEAAFDRATGAAIGPYVWQLPNQRLSAPVIVEPLARLAPVVAQLLGASGLRLLQDGLICKPPGAPSVPWHTDYSYTGYLRPPMAASVRVSLTQAGERDGCLRVVDGSHRWELPDRFLFGDPSIPDGALERLPEPYATEAKARQVTLPLAPGDVSVHHCRTWHTSLPNLGTRTRKTVVTHVFDGACEVLVERLPEHVRPTFTPEMLPWLVGHPE